MTALDLALSLLLVAAALGFLVWQLGLRRRPPACHATPRRQTSGGQVIVDDKLARAVARARAKRGS